MKTWTIAELEARVSMWHPKGKSDSFEECAAAARSGRLYDVDTQSDGEDCLAIGASEDEVIAETAIHHDDERATKYFEGPAEWARQERRWSAEQVRLAE